MGDQKQKQKKHLCKKENVLKLKHFQKHVIQNKKKETHAIVRDLIKTWDIMPTKKP